MMKVSELKEGYFYNVSISPGKEFRYTGKDRGNRPTFIAKNSMVNFSKKLNEIPVTLIEEMTPNFIGL